MEIMLYIMLFVLCGAFAGYVYQQKGRNRLVGLVGGLVLGPVGAILAVMSGEKPTHWTRPVTFGLIVMILFMLVFLLSLVRFL